MKPIWSQ